MLQSAKPKWTITGLIEAPVEQVWEVLLDITPQLSAEDKRKIAQEDGPQHFTVVADYARIRFDIDKQSHSIADQGEWWYRGVQSIEPHERGSILAYRVYNIAPEATRWAVPFVIHRFDTQMRSRMEQTLQAIGARLNCSTTLLTKE